MGEGERILTGDSEAWKSRIVSREESLLDFTSQLEIGLEDSILPFQFLGGGLESIAFLRQRILHLLHSGEIFVNSR